MDDRRRGFLERLFTEQRGKLLAYFRRRIRRKSDAHDLVQEVYLRLLRVKDTEAIRNPEAYLYRVASNLLKEYRLRERQEVPLPDFEESNVHQLLGKLPPLDDEIEGEQIIELLLLAIEHLPPKIREAMILKYRHGLTYDEIAAVMAVSASMVKRYLAMGIALCRLGVEAKL
jgi:RNA polymerase sigma-70 factor (ECF subfamily)